MARRVRPTPLAAKQTAVQLSGCTGREPQLYYPPRATVSARGPRRLSQAVGRRTLGDMRYLILVLVVIIGCRDDARSPKEASEEPSPPSELLLRWLAYSC